MCRSHFHLAPPRQPVLGLRLWSRYMQARCQSACGGCALVEAVLRPRQRIRALRRGEELVEEGGETFHCEWFLETGKDPVLRHRILTQIQRRHVAAVEDQGDRGTHLADRDNRLLRLEVVDPQVEQDRGG